LIIRIRDKAATRGRQFANYVKAVLSIVFGWGAERGHVDSNPAAQNKKCGRGRPIMEGRRTACRAGCSAAISIVLSELTYACHSLD
jgi:hypothetical protein